MKKLYLLKTFGMGEFYVISDDPTSAQNELANRIEVNNRHEYDKSRVISITLITEDSKSLLNERPLFTEFKRLIIA